MDKKISAPTPKVEKVSKIMGGKLPPKKKELREKLKKIINEQEKD